MYILNCCDTAVSFKELLRFKSGIKVGDPLRGLNIYSDYTKTNETFVETLEKIDFAISGFEDTIVNLSNTRLVSVIKSEDKALISRLVKACVKLPLCNGSANALEEFAGNILIPVMSAISIRKPFRKFSVTLFQSKSPTPDWLLILRVTTQTRTTNQSCWNTLL